MVLLLWLLFALAVILLLFALYLWLIAPAHKPYPGTLRRDVLYAHRGLHDGNHAVIENSMQAFTLAKQQTYGMELDIQTTKDGQLVIHHDLNTLRVCGIDAEIEQTNYSDLPLLPDGSKIPLFSELLTLINGEVPLIIEVKYHKQYKRTVRVALSQLDSYHGDYCMESFHPLVVHMLRTHAPGIIRGQLSTGTFEEGINRIAAFAMKHLLINVLSRPHFIAYDFYSNPPLSLKLQSRLFRSTLVAWTVKSQHDLDAARKRYDAVIFEGFIPDSNS